ncbi:ATP-grasp domain-containing protein [Herbidospora mongoliensis]|uniref:ATP-grasp domain-containing protein n=1 Tax=Herbidospora mongoliensis TaxID=688067 RepID=UPI00083618BF|nr:ATP-grasp domain-containing protein [Herbidospora mongoliensis]
MPGWDEDIDHRPTVASVSGRRVVDVMVEAGVRTILFDDPIPLDLAFVADVPVDLDLDDWPAAESVLRRLHLQQPIDAVIGVYDLSLPLAAYLAARLGVRGLSLAAVMNCNDKLRMRLTLRAAAINVPAHVVVSESGEAQAAARRLGYPVLVKKVTGAAGAGTLLCRDQRQVKDAVTALHDDTDPRLLVEEYVDGPEYAIQTVTRDSVTELISVFSQRTATDGRLVELGYDFPPGLDESQESELRRLVITALRALGFDHGIAHTQVRLTPAGPVLINVVARPPGGRLCEVTEAVSGVDMVQAALDVALGIPLSRRAPVAEHVRYRCVTFDQAGTVSYDPGALTERAAPAPLISMDVNTGDHVSPKGGVYGRIISYDDDPLSLERLTGALGLSVQPHPSEGQ